MRYLPEHEETIGSGLVERIVLIVNTYRDTDLPDRTEKDDISVPVQNLA